MGLLNQRLRELRESANPAISAAEMAVRLGYDSRQAYHFYESEGARGFKKAHLPLELAARIAKVLASRGVDSADVMQLAGVGDATVDQPALSAGEEQMLEKWRALTPPQRQALNNLLDTMLGPNLPSSVHTPKHTYRAEGDRA